MRRSGRKPDGVSRAVRALPRPPPETWLVVQGTLAATAAWVIARHIVGNHQPFFAPIAAFVGLNASLGERGRNALRLLLGVVRGIVPASSRSRPSAADTEAWRLPSSPRPPWLEHSGAPGS
jgi:hypothetical protein